MKERPENATGDDAGTNADWNPDGSKVPATPTNKDVDEATAESAEERVPAKRNAEQDALHRTCTRLTALEHDALASRICASQAQKTVTLQ